METPCAWSMTVMKVLLCLENGTKKTKKLENKKAVAAIDESTCTDVLIWIISYIIYDDMLELCYRNYIVVLCQPI